MEYGECMYKMDLDDFLVKKNVVSAYVIKGVKYPFGWVKDKNRITEIQYGDNKSYLNRA